VPSGVGFGLVGRPSIKPRVSAYRRRYEVSNGVSFPAADAGAAERRAAENDSDKIVVRMEVSLAETMPRGKIGGSDHVDGIRRDVDLNLFESLEQRWLEIDEELTVVRPVVHVHDEPQRLVLVSSGLMYPNSADRIGEERNSAELGHEVFSGLLQRLYAHRTAVVIRER
jgi:hypothetical protein